ncbi:MAG: tRNA (adenosine(37)-N6)-threonylcarbamoyltransferase complex dimerization subunit type 1 TsaB [Alphaproteobacteria bacterium]|nr:MAG: tRNA (adenosine(37)-N6)-threonylcarbamoyltransferase complex dimerization subunit type 1 TsaB [Alphaproteobacteria bacterium]
MGWKTFCVITFPRSIASSRSDLGSAAMKTLSLDTALAACSVAIADGDKILAREWIDLPRGHAERLFDLIGAVEAAAGLTAKQMDRMAVTVGPGTFTGLRVGLAAAKGLALAVGCPLIGLSTLHTVALGARQEMAGKGGLLTVAFDARRDEVYHQTFDHTLTPLTDPVIARRAEAARDILSLAKEKDAPLTWLGTGAPILMPLLDGLGEISQSANQPDAGCLALFANHLEDVAPYPAEPLYLRAPDAKLPKTRLFKT